MTSLRLAAVLLFAASAGTAHAAGPAHVRASTRTPPAATVISVTGTAGSVRIVTLSPTGGAAAGVGDVLALGVGKVTPSGLLGRVTAVRRTSGGAIVLTTAPATLAQAVPDGRLAVSRHLALTASTGLTPQALLFARSLGPCGSGTGLSDYAPTATLDGTVVLQARWHTPPGASAARLDAARFTLSGTLRLAVSPDLPAAPACAFDAPLGEPVSLPPIRAHLGRVPVVITPQVTFALQAAGGTGGVVFYRASGAFATTAGVAFAKARYRPLAALAGSFRADPVSVDASANASVAIRTDVRLLVGGVAGAALTFTGGTALSADPQTAAPAPWWTLRSTFDAGGSLDLGRWLLPRHWSKAALVHSSQLIAAATGSAAAPASTSAPRISDVQGRTPPVLGDTLQADAGTWSGARSTTTYQWQRCMPYDLVCSDVAGATGTTYVLGPHDAARLFRVNVTAGNDVGARTATSAMTGIVKLGGTIVSLGTGEAAACGVQPAGSVVCWGVGDTIGDGTVPAQFGVQALGIVSGLSDARAVDGGESQVCALRATGGVVCWGHTLVGGGLGNGSAETAVPVAVTGLTDATAVSVGDENACALRSGGTVACWGWNGNGELGNGTMVDAPAPVAVSGLQDAIAVSAGSDHACAIRADHTVVCWGNAWHGEIGSDPQLLPDSETPVAVAGVTSVVAVDAAGYFTCALRSTGTVTCWGDSEFGEMGNGTIALTSWMPTTVSGVTDAVAIAINRYHACALRAGGSVVCWGGSDPGQDDAGLPTSAVPVTVKNLADAIAIGAAGDGTYALRRDGSVVTWGIGDALTPHEAPGL